MILCNNCGQCSHISGERFIEFRSVSGTETLYLNPETGDVDDYGDSNLEGTGDSDYECPYCGSADIEWDAEPTEEEAFNMRAEYEKEQRARMAHMEQMRKQEETKRSEWDLVTN